MHTNLVIFHGNINVNFLLFIRDLVVVISANVIVVVSMAEVPVVPSRSVVASAKHNLHGKSPTFIT